MLATENYKDMMRSLYELQKQLEKQIQKEIPGRIFCLDKTTSYLEGLFKSNELRLIADKMDELEKIYVETTR